MSTLLLAVCGVTWGAEIVSTTIDFTTAQVKLGNYTTEYTWDSNWTVYGCGNNSQQWKYARFGGKSLDNAEVYITGTTSIADAITKVSIAHNGKSRAAVTLNKVTLITASDAAFTENLNTVDVTGIELVKGNTLGADEDPPYTIDITPSTGTDFGTNRYYKIVFTISNSDSSNGGIDVYYVNFYKQTTGAVDPTVSFASESVTVTEGKTVTNELTKPNDLTVTYSSDDDGVATVAADGTVTGVAPGEATITASWEAVTDQYNAGSISYTVTVEEAVAVAPEVSFESESASVKVGKTVTNALTKPDDLTVRFSSTDESIATVDEDGVVTGVAEGETTITVSWDAVEKTYLAGSKSYTLTVTAAGGEETLIEKFETAEASTSYNSTKTYTEAESDCGVGWEMYYGTVSTNDKIDGTKSAQMRYYANASSNLPYIMTTTPLEGLTHIAFKARVSDTKIKFNVSYSANGTSWTNIATDEQLEEAGASGVTEFEYDIPSGGQYIKIGVSSNTSAPESGNWKFLIDNVAFTINEVSEHTPSVELSQTEIIAGFEYAYVETTPETLVVTLSTENPGIADYIESERAFTGESAGTTNVTVSWDAQTIDGVDYAAGSKTFELTVTLAQPNVSIDTTSLNLDDANTATITLDPEDLQVTYSSSDETVVTVADGIVTAVGEGSAMITVSWEEHYANDILYGADSQTFDVTVSAPVTPVTYYKVTQQKQLYPGNEYILVSEESNVAMGESGSNTYRAAVEVEISSENTITITNEAVAVLTLDGSTDEWTFQPSDSEVVLGIKNDSSNRLDNTEDNSLWSITDDFQVINNAFSRYIRYNSGTNPSRFSTYKSGQKESVLYVKEGYTESEKETATVEISLTEIIASLDYAIITTNPEGLVVTYSSDNPDVADVSSEGQVDGYGEGTANITVTWEDQTVDGVEYYGGSKTFTVTVSLSVANVSIDTTSLNLDDATTATITLDPEDLQVTYASSNEDVATVADGIVTAVGTGTATITVSWDEHYANDLLFAAGSQTFEITVSDEAPVKCVFEEDYYTRFDFTKNGWGFPTSKKVEEGEFTNYGKTIKLAGTSGNGYRYYDQGYLLNGRDGSYLTLPAFDFDVMAIEVTGRSGASASVKQNIFVNDDEVSTETEGAQGTNLYFINEGYQEAGTIYTLKVTSNHNTQFTEIKVYKKDAFVELNVTDASYRTYCDTDALDFNVASPGLKSYIVEGVDAEGSTNLVLKEVNKVQTETGVLLEAEEGTYYVAKLSPETEEGATVYDDVSTNQLVGVTEETEVEPSIIVLMDGENGVGFYKTSKTFTVGAHTAYLPISALETVADAGADGVKTLNINVDNDTPTGINCISAAELSGKDAVIYNLKGQRVSRAVKGIYIVNGKKVMVK